MPRLILISFADNRFRNSLVRLQKQTEHSFRREIFPYGEDSTLKEILEKTQTLVVSPWFRLLGMESPDYQRVHGKPAGGRHDILV